MVRQKILMGIVMVLIQTSKQLAWLICSLMSLVVVLTDPLGLPTGFPLVPFLNGIVFYYRYRKKANKF